MKIKWNPWGVVVLLFLFSCQSNYSDNGMADNKEYTEETMTEPAYEEEAEYASSSSKDEPGNNVEEKMMTSSAARLFMDSTHKFVVRSSVKFKVDDVYKATLQVENLASKMDGFVIHSNLNSNVSRTYDEKISLDSMLEVTEFYRSIDMQIKVPSKNLEPFLLSIASEISFLNYRNINAEEVTIQLKAHRWMQEQFKEYQDEIRDITVPSKNKSTLSELEKIKFIYQQKEVEKNRLVEHWKLQDDIEYALVSINMYGRDQKQITKLPIPDDIEKYEPGFWTKAKDGFYQGWKGIQVLFLGLITVWPLWVIGLVIWLVIRRWIKRKSQNHSK